MAVIKREPTPPGPITALFDRLHAIHLAAGQPSMREIASGIGRGVISSSTIHNMFRGPRVPKWGFLELVVEELHGDIAEFRVLWQAARLAEDEAGMADDDPEVTRQPGNGTLMTDPPEKDTPVIIPSQADPVGFVAPGPSQRIWSDEIPQRNPNFTGRAAELEALRANLAQGRRAHPPAQLISGMGGVGKTEIATEYIHRHRDNTRLSGGFALSITIASGTPW